MTMNYELMALWTMNYELFYTNSKYRTRTKNMNYELNSKLWTGRQAGPPRAFEPAFEPRPECPSGIRAGARSARSARGQAAWCVYKSIPHGVHGWVHSVRGFMGLLRPTWEFIVILYLLWFQTGFIALYMIVCVFS